MVFVLWQYTAHAETTHAPLVPHGQLFTAQLSGMHSYGKTVSAMPGKPLPAGVAFLAAEEDECVQQGRQQGGQQQQL